MTIKFQPIIFDTATERLISKSVSSMNDIAMGLGHIKAT